MPDTVVITTHDLGPAIGLRDIFERDGYAVELLTATERIRGVENPVLLILTGGLEEKRARRLVREAIELDRLPVIGLADPPGHGLAENRRRLGLSECFAKPIELEDVALVARRVIERRRLQALTGIVGETEAVREALERVVQIAPVHSTVLVTGESGTGKELVARGIHDLSSRRHRPFIPANVAALTETLLESELFGHEKGAFTGAVAQRKGLFELANKGTLFLDEIGEMPPATQSKLLRVLESREFMLVGGEQPLQVDVRFIAATNQDLRTLVELGTFRRDLYYRLNVLHIELPPLRQRREDIPLLIETFIHQTSREHGRPEIVLSPEALAVLLEYPWPGNVRELRNLVESMVVLAPGRVIRPEDIPPAVRSAAAAPSRTVLPVPLAPRVRLDGDDTAPQLEFVFRTLLQLRVDLEDLRRDFDQYRRAHPELPGPVQLPYPYPYLTGSLVGSPLIQDAELPAETVESAGEGAEEEGAVVYRRGMTMQELEREAITLALRDVRGNRRKAAELLGIGERTLYRKIKEYGIPF
ncbi:MAG: sigma-54-dependent Fis family transcriptional regulator [Gemmatimonadetes bacterium]|nr:sigma-54-dependent Fis family transcriptional regulator [Gemmatimonadota bacterium]